MTDPEAEIADPERRLALAYVPAARRPAVEALWLLDERLARITFAAREPAIGQMRLVWWRDALARLDDAPPPAEPLLRRLAADLLPAGVGGADIAAMTAGWDAVLPPDALDDDGLALHLTDRGERLFALTGRLLGGVPPAGAGARWARADLHRQMLLGGRQVPAALSHAPSAAGVERSARWPVPLRPLGMLAALAGRDPAEAQGAPGRVLRMLRHRLTGR